MTQPFRIEPKLPVEAVKTYGIRKPIATHFRPGSCTEAGCANMAHGWRTVIDEATDLGQRQAHYIRKESGRRFTETRDDAGLTTFTFEAGQTCFAQHQISLEREPFYVVRGGDWRGNPRGDVRRHVSPDDWVDDFANHQNELADRLSQG
jgi:hypothetical protein